MIPDTNVKKKKFFWPPVLTVGGHGHGYFMAAATIVTATIPKCVRVYTTYDHRASVYICEREGKFDSCTT